MTETGSGSTRFQRGSDVVPSDVVPGSSAEGRVELRNRVHVKDPNQVPEPGERNHVVKRGTAAHGSSDADQVQTASASAVRGKSGDPKRGTWCTNAKLAKALGRFDLDPFSNPRSHIDANAECMLERGDDGFGREREKRRGEGWYYRAAQGFSRSYADTKVWLQPPYGIVLRVLRHYAHTRWMALFRFDPRPEWFRAVYDPAELVVVLEDPEVRNFEAPPGMNAPGSTFPHAIYARRAEDVPDEVLAMGVAWRKKPRDP